MTEFDEFDRQFEEKCRIAKESIPKALRGVSDKDIEEDRAKQYGDAKLSFGRIATMWETYLGVPIESSDVAVCMSLLKVCRSTTAKGYHLNDSFQDARIYLKLAEELKDNV